MISTINNKDSLTFKDVLDAGKDLVIGALTLAATVALVAKPIFATFGAPAVLTKVGAALGLGLLGGPVGWAILGGTALFGAAYFGYKSYQAYQDWKNENAERKNSVRTEPGSIKKVAKKEEEREENEHLLDNTIPHNPQEDDTRKMTGKVTKYI
jgi:hypothetical protein